MALTKEKLIEIIESGDLSLTNQNILHNWDFRNPVNQRGVTSPPTSGEYFLDRWVSSSTDTVWNSAGYVSVPNGHSMKQSFEGVGLAGKVLTYSWLLTSGVIETYTFTMPSNTSETIGGNLVASTNYSTGVTSVNNYFLGGKNIVAVKLEMGTVSTIHLDPPMDHAVELPKCQRFFRHYPYATYGIANAYNPIDAQTVLYGIPMRIVPTLTANKLSLYDGTPHTVTGFSGVTLTIGGGVAISITATGLTAGRGYRLQHQDASSYLSLSSDL